MRIISGKYKGLKLRFPKNQKFRPTQDRVKEAIFSIIQNDIPDAHFLDLCCGTAGISIEAISRGAKQVIAVDQDTSIAHKNKDLLSSDDQAKLTIVTKKISSFFKQCTSKFDIIFLDPPWESTQLYELTLKQICEFDILASSGKLIIEYSKKSNVPFDDFQFSPTLYQYGDTMIGLLKL